MRTITCITAATLFCVCAAQLASASDATSYVLNGSYVFQKVENCGGGVMVQATGVWKFNSLTKKYSASGYSISGVPLTISSVSASGTYTTSSTEVTFDGSTSYYAFYGVASGSAASKVVLIALGTGPCGEQFIMSR